METDREYSESQDELKHEILQAGDSSLQGQGTLQPSTTPPPLLPNPFGVRTGHSREIKDPPEKTS